ncbi:MAG: helix-turn-helix domain-containing protein, partial [Caulobacteraceae bacterium]|nr:helix-turn-helix domain-containing protein [Caulobacteraceae bacterium]
MGHSLLQDDLGTFTIIPNQFLSQSGNFSDHAFRLFVLLRYHTDNQSEVAFPSYKRIQSMTGWSTKTVAKAVKELMAAGWLNRKRRFNDSNVYRLQKPAQSFPTESPQYFPTESTSTFPRKAPVLSEGKTNKTNINTKNSHSSGSKNPHYDYFAQRYEEKYKYPYVNKQADFVRYNSWKKADSGRSSNADFERAVLNYLASPLGQHTFADLVTRFAVFRLSPLDSCLLYTSDAAD